MSDAQIEQIWATYDTNANGVLDREEAQKFYTEFVEKDEFLKATVTDFESFFTKVDEDKDGKVTKDELIKFFQ